MMINLECFDSCDSKSPSPASGVGVSIAAQGTPTPAERGIDEQVQTLRYAMGLKSEPVLVWRLYRLYRANGMPIPSDLLRQLDCLAQRAEQRSGAARADDTQRRATALLKYAYTIEDGERPALALQIASDRSGISANAIKTMASRSHIRTRPYRARSRSFDTNVLSRASDPFGLAK